MIGGRKIATTMLKAPQKDEVKEAIGGSYAFDMLCLVLGLATNLVQVVDDAKRISQNSRVLPFF